METIYLCIIIFLFVLAVFDLIVGVSNDAVNFLNSAVGAKAASFKTILFIAGIGIFIGASLSNGMMDIARHGIYQPEHFYFAEIMCILLAVMLTDVVLLDVFNSMGMPTSTTVSLVFELLGGTFALSLIKVNNDATLALGDLINTDKALSVIMAIFVSVAIAFFFGMLVQWLARIVFTFNYTKNIKYSIGLFGGIAATSIIYFMLIKGLKDSSFMTPENKQWIQDNTLLLIASFFVFFTALMQVLHWLKVNVFKVVVLMGTFALALAFAGNDLVNFIGVPLAGYSSFIDYTTNGAGASPDSFLMTSLLGPAKTPWYFLIGAGAIMVYALCTSKKAHAVIKTSVDLSRQDEGEENFGSTPMARTLVRFSMTLANGTSRIMPESTKQWINSRFRKNEAIIADGAAFDLVRASVNLVLAGLLIALGTSLKLPLSTTYVTFMVAMGTSLADRAWGRESAVFRITGVISVIGGWFITAGVAFIGAGMVVCLMHLGGIPVMIAGGVIAIGVLIRSNIRFRKKKQEVENDTLFQTILSTEDTTEVWPLLRIYINEKFKMFLQFAATAYDDVAGGFLEDNSRMLSRAEKALVSEKDVLKSQRRKMTVCLRKVAPETAIEKSTWFHLETTMAMSMTYNLRRVNEVCKEHVDNNFRPLPAVFHDNLAAIREKITAVLRDSEAAIEESRPDVIDGLRRRCDEIKNCLTARSREVYEFLRNDNDADMTVAYVYLNLLQESQEMVTSLRKLLRASGKLNLAPSSYRSFTHPRDAEAKAS